MEIRINHSILSDAPYNETNKALFLATGEDGANLIDDLRNGSPTCYLVSGYRGAGKSSFIKKIEEAIKAPAGPVQPRPVVFVYLNFSKNETYGHLFRKLIRGLYLQLKDDQYVPDELLEELYKKTFYDTVTNVTVASKTEGSVEYGIDLVAYVKLVAGPLVLLFAVFNAWYNLIPVNKLASFGVAAVAAWDSLAKIIKVTKSSSRKKTEQADLNIRSMYDDEIADYHFLNILKKIAPDYKLVFVLDEMDKIGDEAVDTILKEMKPYLVSGLASFIVVAGQSLYYKYAYAKMEDDAILSSIFSKAVHIGLLSRYEQQKLLAEKLITNYGSLEEEKRLQLSAYADYIIFEAKRVPRKFISLLRKDVVWKDGQAYLVFDDGGQRYSIFSRVNDIIEKIDQTEIASLGFDQALRDFFVTQLFISCHEVLFTRSQAFALGDLKSGIKESDFQVRWKSFINEFLSSLISTLEKEKIITRASEQPLKYKLNIWLQDLLLNTTDPSDRSLVQQLTDLRAITNNIGSVLFEGQGNERLTMSKILQKLEQSDAVDMTWKNRDTVMNIFDNLDNYINDPAVLATVQRMITDENISISQMTVNLLDHFGQRSAKEYFKEYGYEKFNDYPQIDNALQGVEHSIKLLAFDFKLRRKGPVPDGETVIQSLELLDRLNKETRQNTHLLLVVFNYEAFNEFEKLRFRFREVVKDVTGFEGVKHKLHFLPVTTTGLHLLSSDEFENFRKKYIFEIFSFTFANKRPPVQFPARNDDFYTRVFESKKGNFTVTINPGETKYWRFGFSFSKNNRYPGFEGPRHNDRDIADIHLCAGDAVDGDISKWSYGERLVLNNYHIQPVKDDYNERHDYRGQQVILKLFSNPGNKISFLEIFVDGERRGDRWYDLTAFNYCTLSAWCDGQPFKLDTVIRVDYKEEN